MVTLISLEWGTERRGASDMTESSGKGEYRIVKSDSNTYKENQANESVNYVKNCKTLLMDGSNLFPKISLGKRLSFTPQ